jgi:hypothetical protein
LKPPFATHHPWFGAIFLASVGFACTHAQIDDHRLDTTARLPEVTITEGVLFLDGTKVQLPATPQEFVKLLGKPTREWKNTNADLIWHENGIKKQILGNTILIWDDLGITVYVNRNIKKSSTINFSLQQESFAFSPKKTFTGKIIVDGAEITRASTVDQINVATMGKQFRLVFDFIPDQWSAAYATGTIHVRTVAPPGKGVKSLQLGISL